MSDVQPSFGEDYLRNVITTFTRYKTYAEQAIEQVSENRINWYFHNDSNSLAILVKHMSGNLASRFTDFLTSDGEKKWRKRDGEFEDDIHNYQDLMDVWNAGWKVLFETLDELRVEDLGKTVKIRNEEHSIVEALNRAMTHQAYHVGQIVFLAKMLAPEWKSLSIPKKRAQPASN